MFLPAGWSYQEVLSRGANTATFPIALWRSRTHNVLEREIDRGSKLDAWRKKFAATKPLLVDDYPILLLNMLRITLTHHIHQPVERDDRGF